MIVRVAGYGVIFIMAASACHAADLYPVAGTIINAQTGAALPHAQIYIYKSGTARPRSPFITGDDGRFSFQLTEGAYALRGGTRTRLQSYGSRNPDSALGSAVIVGPGQNTGNLIFRWLPPAAISGRVLDDSGEPVEGALVQLLFSHVTAGRRATTTFRWDRTNDRGEYRFGSIPGGGRYYVAVTGKPWYGVNILGFPQVDQQQERPVAFIPRYYPNTPDGSGAAPLLVKPGEEARADFTLTTSSGANVSVKYTGPADLQGVLSLTIEGIAGSDSFQEQQTLQPAVEGVRLPQLLSDVPPGRYVVQIRSTSGDAGYSGRTTVDVSGSDVTVEIPLLRTAQLSGEIKFQNAGAKPAGRLLVSLIPEDGTGVRVGAFLRPDGSFVFPNVQTGKYRVGMGGVNGFFVARTEAKGVAFRDGVLNLAEGDSGTISVTLSDETGRLKGFVTNGDRPAEAVLAVLAPVGESPDPMRYRGYQTESDGSFDFRNVPAGQYRLFAIGDTDFEYADPAAIQPYLADAKSVTIESHGSSTERIPLTAAKGR